MQHNNPTAKAPPAPVWPWRLGLFLYYLAILLALLLIYGRGDFAAPKFIYQGF